MTLRFRSSWTALLPACWCAAAAFAQCEPEWVQLNVSGPQERSESGLAFDAANGVTVMYGGDLPGVPLADTWLWSGVEWTQAAPVSTPGHRRHLYMEYDTARQRVVLFGGVSDTHRSDVWEWNGDEWTERPLSSGPSPRRQYGMSYDRARDHLLIFGGIGSSFPILGDTWELGPGGWSARPGVGPSPRVKPGVAYDDARGLTLLFGGQLNSAGAPSGETWTWDGASWTLIAGTGPSARYNAEVVYCDSIGKVLLFGGATGNPSVPVGETWVWDGVSWEELLIPGPPAREGHRMVYDSIRNRIVLFGGRTLAGYLGDTWELVFSPFLSTHPESAAVEAGQAIELEVGHSPANGASIAWIKDDEPLADDDRITGSNSTTLRIEPALVGDAGEYWAQVTTACGSTTSERATVTILCRADVNGDGQQTVPDIFDFLTCWFAGDISCANFNADCCINVGDIFDFLTAWFAGCP